MNAAVREHYDFLVDHHPSFEHQHADAKRTKVSPPLGEHKKVQGGAALQIAESCLDDTPYFFMLPKQVPGVDADGEQRVTLQVRALPVRV
jgi:hypothetical protein